MLYTDLNSEIDVGSSGHLLELGGFKILVDCGLHPKYMGLAALPKLSKITPETLDFIAITHTHLDHCGALPVVMRTQNHAHILVADESADLLPRMLRNSRSVMAKQREEFDIKEYPLFDSSEIDEVRRRLMPMSFHHEKCFEIDGGRIGITFTPAGHIPGAASVMFEYKKQRVLFSGDISFHSTGILKGAVPPEGKVDTLVVETTRGSYSRPAGVTYDSEVDRLVSSMANVLMGGGSVLIPAFALGRMQEIIFIIQRAKQRKQIPDVPVFAGGLGLDIAEYFIKGAKRSSTFSFGKQHMEGVKPLRAEIVAGKDFETQGIYVLGSGMMVELSCRRRDDGQPRQRNFLRGVCRRRHARKAASARGVRRPVRFPRPVLRRNGELPRRQVRPYFARRPRGDFGVHYAQGSALRCTHAWQYGVARVVYGRDYRPLAEDRRNHPRTVRIRQALAGWGVFLQKNSESS